MFDETDPEDPSEPPVMSYRWSEVRRHAWHLAYMIKTEGPPSAAKDKAIQHLEETVLWAEEAVNNT